MACSKIITRKNKKDQRNTMYTKILGLCMVDKFNTGKINVFSKIMSCSKIITRKNKKGQRNTNVHKDPGVVYGRQVQHRQNQCSSKNTLTLPSYSNNTVQAAATEYDQFHTLF